MKKEYDDTNPLHVFQNVYDVITDRKEHPKEGSYTNYLFEKGLDKILKKCGEECSEVMIAAKNDDHNELVMEISDLLYHLTVLMVHQNVTVEDINAELEKRSLKSNNLKVPQSGLRTFENIKHFQEILI